MTKYYDIPEEPVYNSQIRELQDTDRASATDTFNPLFSQLIENTEAVRNEKFAKADILQEFGANADKVMSQKAVTRAIEDVKLITPLINNETLILYVSASGNDNTADGSSAKPYKTLQAAYEAIPDLWLGSVTIQLNSGSYNMESEGSPDTNVLDTRDAKKHCSEIRITGTASMTEDGTRLYGGIYLSGKPKFMFEKLWLFAPHLKATEDNALINIGRRVIADFNDIEIYGGGSGAIYTGTLIDTKIGSSTTLENISFQRANNGVRTAGGIVLIGNAVFQNTMQGTVNNRCLFAYNGGLIVFGGENKSTIGNGYIDGGIVFFNGTLLE